MDGGAVLASVYVDLDFETVSSPDLNLIRVGADRYAQDASTEVICAVFDGHVWFPDGAGDVDADWLLRQFAADPNVIFVAHNASFEQAIWRWIMVPKFGFPPLPVERWACTQASCAWKALPQSLENAAEALHLEAQKDMEGHRLVLSLSREKTKVAHAAGYPGKAWGTKTDWMAGFVPGVPPEITPDIRRRVAEYCKNDVTVEKAIRHKIGLLSPNERTIWRHDQAINQRGIRIDTVFVEAAREVVYQAKVPLLVELEKRTGVDKAGSPKLLDWVRANGADLPDMRATTIARVLGEPEILDDDEAEEGVGNISLPKRCDLSEDVIRVLEIRSMLASTSVDKLNRMLECTSPDGRARGLLQYHAAGTGRWAGRRVQPQNLPRGDWARRAITPEQTVEAIKSRDLRLVEERLGVPAIKAVSHSLRHALIPDPGKIFRAADYSGIEARMVLALAGQHDKTALMATPGVDVYLDMAHQIYRLPPGTLTKANVVERTIGKNTVLGCGFQMGWQTFRDRYCPEQSEEFAQGVIDTYRNIWACKVPELWWALNDAALECVRTGLAQEAYGVLYRMEGEFLTATLPNKWQKLWYHNPQLTTNRFGKPAWSYLHAKPGRTVITDAYGGLLTENVVSALARGLLCAAIDRIERAGLPIVLTVHDEILIEVEQREIDQADFEALMAEPTWWSEEIGVPIQVEGWEGTCYRK